MNSYGLRAAVVTSDIDVAESVATSLERLGIQSMHYEETELAIERVIGYKFDACFVDRDIDPELSVLTNMRTSRGNSRSLGFAIIPGNQPLGGSFRLADFMLTKPIVTVRLDQTLRAAYGIMLTERLKYFRKPLRTTVTLIDAAPQSVSAVSINISRGGMALECQEPLASGQTFQIEFRVPVIKEVISCRAQVVWSDGHSRAGVSFGQMNTRQTAVLNSWLEKEFHAATALSTKKASRPSDSLRWNAGLPFELVQENT